MDEAPIPNVSIVLVISSIGSLNTSLRSRYQIEISSSPSPTTVKPITEPAENATFRPLFRLFWHAAAVLAFALVAICIPTNPDRPEKKPPVTKAKGTNHVSRPRAAITNRITNITAKNPIRILYWRRRYAIAPLWMDPEIFFMVSFPSGKRSTFCALLATNKSAMMEPNSVSSAN